MDGVEDGLPHRSDGEDNEEQALQGRPAARAICEQPRLTDHGVGEVSILPGARGEGIVGEQGHEQGSGAGGQSGGGKDRAPAFMPAAPRMLLLTARMRAMVTKVVRPAKHSWQSWCRSPSDEREPVGKHRFHTNTSQ